MKLRYLVLVVVLSGCGIRGYKWASHGPGDTSIGDVTHAQESGARVVVPKKASKSTSVSCDSEFQKHVYNPQRLVHVKDCVVVEGVVVDATHGKKKDGARHEADGDNHSWLRLDKEYEQYLNDGNKQFEEGNMVYELQCLFPVTQRDAISVCEGWRNPIKLPPVGAHVRMWGTLVTETNHGKWREIHPVTAWEAIK